MHRYAGPQAWQLTFKGELKTAVHGSVVYGSGFPPHTKVAAGDRCIAFVPHDAAAATGGAADGVASVDGNLMLVACDEAAEDGDAGGVAETHYARTWMYDVLHDQLVNVDFPSRVSPHRYCLVAHADGGGGGSQGGATTDKKVFSLSPCGAVEGDPRATWYAKRLHKPKSESLTDDLHLQDFAFNMTRSVEIGYTRDIGDMCVCVCVRVCRSE